MLLYEFLQLKNSKGRTEIIQYLKEMKKEKIMDYSSTYGKVNFHRYLGNAI